MDRIRLLRREHKLSQQELGARLGRTRNSISQWELGKQIPGIVDIGELCKIFRVSSDYLLGLSNDSREPAWLHHARKGKPRANLQRLRELRLERRVTQHELAREIGRACSTISVWEREMQTPAITDISELCRLFGVSSDYLLGLSSERRLTALPDLSDGRSDLFAAHLPADTSYAMLNPEGQKLMAQFFEVALRLFPAVPDAGSPQSEAGAFGSRGLNTLGGAEMLDEFMDDLDAEEPEMTEGGEWPPEAASWQDAPEDWDGQAGGEEPPDNSDQTEVPPEPPEMTEAAPAADSPVQSEPQTEESDGTDVPAENPAPEAEADPTEQDEETEPVLEPGNIF
ncbi:MAG: helix-turn-helix domain-containing protein [Clostridia bacterium]|nr:helix-turn-helix domain-containing protein [Clostridia bacterium]